MYSRRGKSFPRFNRYLINPLYPMLWQSQSNQSAPWANNRVFRVGLETENHVDSIDDGTTDAIVS